MDRSCLKTFINDESAYEHPLLVLYDNEAEAFAIAVAWKFRKE